MTRWPRSSAAASRAGGFCGDALLLLADTLERLVAACRSEQREPGELPLVVQQVAAEHLA